MHETSKKKIFLKTMCKLYSSLSSSNGLQRIERKKERKEENVLNKNPKWRMGEREERAGKENARNRRLVIWFVATFFFLSSKAFLESKEAQINGFPGMVFPPIPKKKRMVLDH